MKLTKEQISKIKELREEGKSTYQIAKQFKVAQSTIFYYVGESQKERIRKSVKKSYNLKTKEQKKELQIRRRKYQREYHKRRYHEDKEFREKIKKVAREYKKVKALEIKS